MLLFIFPGSPHQFRRLLHHDEFEFERLLVSYRVELAWYAQDTVV